MGVAKNKKVGEIGIHARFRTWCPEGVGVRVSPLAPTHLSEISPFRPVPLILGLLTEALACFGKLCRGQALPSQLSIPPQLAASGGRLKPRKLKAASVTVRSSC